MSTKTVECHFCHSPLVRKSAPSVKAKHHFCNLECKASWQKLSKPVTQEWLIEHYVTKGMDCTMIAGIVGRDPKSVWNWLKDFGIETRKRGHSGAATQFKAGSESAFKGKKHSEQTKKNMRELSIATGRVPFDPEVGSYMKGRKGEDTTNWKGGITPQRQAFYSTTEWAAAVVAVWKRDNAACRKCGRLKKDDRSVSFDIHHVVGFECVELRAAVSNLVLLCEPCHYWVHSKKNENKEFIKDVPK